MLSLTVLEVLRGTYSVLPPVWPGSASGLEYQQEVPPSIFKFSCMLAGGQLKQSNFFVHPLRIKQHSHPTDHDVPSQTPVVTKKETLVHWMFDNPVL